MTRMDISQLPPKYQNFIRKHMRLHEDHAKPRAPKPTAFGYEFDSKLELQFAGYLDILEKAGKIDEWRYHPIRVRLASNCTYEPDFGVWDEDMALTLYEVKGSWKAKNARDSRTRLIIAASMFQWWQWEAVTRDGGMWRFERMNPTEVPMD